MRDNTPMDELHKRTPCGTCWPTRPLEATALIAPETGRRWTYGALRAQVTALAAQLADLGVGRGDRVAIVLPNGLEDLAAFLAVVHGARSPHRSTPPTRRTNSASTSATSSHARSLFRPARPRRRAA